MPESNHCRPPPSTSPHFPRDLEKNNTGFIDERGLPPIRLHMTREKVVGASERQGPGWTALPLASPLVELIEAGERERRLLRFVTWDGLEDQRRTATPWSAG